MRKALVGAVFVTLTILIWGCGYGAQQHTPGSQAQTEWTRTSSPYGAERIPALRHWIATRPDDSASRTHAADQGAAGMPGTPRDGQHDNSTTDHVHSVASKNLSFLWYEPLSSRGGDPFNNCLGNFTVTAYTNSAQDTGKQPGDPGYGITTSGAQATAFHTIAADWHVLPAGTRIRIEGLPGEYIVQDTGGAVRGRHIDVFMNTEHEATVWGVRVRKITILEWGEKNHG